jgi:predicted enzyme related to lactoylglutathione lyase
VGPRFFGVDNVRVARGSEEESPVFRLGGISYLRIPAEDPAGTAAFYEAVFGWSLGGSPDEPSFEDGTGHVIGHFIAGLPVAGEAGVRPYVYVERVDETLDKIVSHGGEVVTAPYAEGDLRVATFSDPAGNVIGVWQRDLAE